MVSFTTLTFFPRGKSTRYLLNRIPGGPSSESGRFKNFLSLLGLEIHVVQLVAYCHYAD